MAKFNSNIATLLTSCPEAGQGVHNWIWRATVAMHELLSSDQVIALLTVATNDCGRDCARDIKDAVAKVMGGSGVGRSSARRQNVLFGKHKPESILRKIEVNDRLRTKIVKQGQTLSDLSTASPTRLPADQREIAPFVLDRLFLGDPLLCVAKSIDDHATLRKHELAKPYIYSHIVPNPMSKPWGINQKGEESQRCLDNTGARDYLVIEFDLPVDAKEAKPTDKEFVQWAKQCGKTVQDVSAALLTHLAKAAPLVAVVDSAHKSLHGWFNVQDWHEKNVLRFMGLAVRLGADPSTYTKCQLVRMPGGVRCNEEGEPVWLQEVIYFDESKGAKPEEAMKNG